MKKAQKCLGESSKEKKPLRRSNHIWEYANKLNVKETVCKEVV
jgi:hypothetical protein